MSTPNALISIFDNSEERKSGFLENSSRIFSSDKTDAALYWGGEFVSLSFLRQTHSWGRLPISYPSFKLLQSKLSIFTPSLDLVSNHGFKTSDVDEHEIYDYSRVYGISVGISASPSYRPRSLRPNLLINIFPLSQNILELCYTIWYPARNGRQDGGNPWSMRKFTAYENQRPHELKNSTCIFIQVPDYSRSKLFEICKNDPGQPILKHIGLISAFDYNWSGYLMQFRDNLINKTQKWLYYSVGEEPIYEQRNTIFQDQQNLEVLRRELLIVHQRLLANNRVLRMMQLQSKDHSNIWCRSDEGLMNLPTQLYELCARNKIHQDYVEFEVKKLDSASVLVSATTALECIDF
ncbi:hypothetical protein TWF192_007072 [Orbilia oligospora]|uniref:Uncharacterized protein n=1 Tax=Orbilia oligospora TaxID=2813651 RepID=A0A6G1MLX2_ORBOL|nr:hypothetical protein TWF191_000250 [Orbilia oligospora]KAF3262398.1 hypothetical protein TWF192_007072 [Orbilia oligospora]